MAYLPLGGMEGGGGRAGAQNAARAFHCGLNGAKEVTGGGLSPSPAGNQRYAQLNREDEIGV